MPSLSDALLVTGASGHLGQGVLRHLLDTLRVPAPRVIAVTRQPAALAAFAARGITVRRGDFDDAASLPDAFAGAQRLLLISTDVLDRPGRRVAQHRAAIAAASAVGVQHLVYLSMPCPEESPVAFAPDHAQTEQSLALSALAGWTVLRNQWYCENLLHWVPAALASGHWHTATGTGGVAYIARDDLAFAAAVALASEGGGKSVLTLTGTASHTAADVARLVSNVTGRRLEVVPVPMDALMQGMLRAGIPHPMATIYATVHEAIAGGWLAEVTQDFRALTGREPQPLQAWLTQQRPALMGAATDFAGA